MRALLVAAVLCAAALGCGPVQPGDDGSAPADAALEAGFDGAVSEGGVDVVSGDPVDERRRCGPMCVAGETCGPDGYCAPGPDAGDAAAEGGPTCPAPATRCGADCVDTTREVTACGACDRACPGRDGANVMVVCNGGACGFTCVAPFGDCDGNPENGCEFRLGVDRHCGACGRVCAPGLRCVVDATTPFGQCRS
jgi:hypothetical protein